MVAVSLCLLVLVDHAKLNLCIINANLNNVRAYAKCIKIDIVPDLAACAHQAAL